MGKKMARRNRTVNKVDSELSISAESINADGLNESNRIITSDSEIQNEIINSEENNTSSESNALEVVNENTSEKIQEALPISKAYILEDFILSIPILGHPSARCNVAFKQGSIITDLHTIKCLQASSKPVEFE